MRRPLETARRWMAQAEHSLEVSQLMLNSKFWSNTCFESEQTAQLALKAFLYYMGRRSVPIHSIRELTSECVSYDNDFVNLLRWGNVLDRYYLSTRYPDALPSPAIPYQSFDEADAVQALEAATEIVELVRAKIPQQQRNG